MFALLYREGESGVSRTGFKSADSTSQLASFLSKIIENNSSMVMSKKESDKKLSTHNCNEPKYNIRHGDLQLACHH